MIDNQSIYRWQINKTNDPTFRISTDTSVTYEGTLTEVIKWVEETYSPRDIKINELFKTITIYT